MDHTPMLVHRLTLHLGWHRARIQCLASLIVAVCKSKTVTRTDVATAFPGTAAMASHDTRLQRFLQHVESKPRLIATGVVALLPEDTSPRSRERTHGMLGCLQSHVLVWSVGHAGMAFPVVGRFLQKNGHAHTQERLPLLEKCIALFGVEHRDGL